MAQKSIYFFCEDVEYTLKNKKIVRQWISSTIKAEGIEEIEELSFIYCSDEYLLSINQQYLNHDTYTDIITFDNSDVEEMLSGDIFISYERVKENATLYNISTRHEMHRIMIHGVLHLCGYLDKTKKEKEIMTQKEDFYLKKLDTLLENYTP